ncbi:MAG TPA: hypothetical protein VNZ64_17565 [Candidatus Acidoferrum sp.]|jgi:hypothetical protein|nr:hypothetical protein [Candidatus Acidoferrum sp.]
MTESGCPRHGGYQLLGNEGLLQNLDRSQSVSDGKHRPCLRLSRHGDDGDLRKPFDPCFFTWSLVAAWRSSCNSNDFLMNNSGLVRDMGCSQRTAAGLAELGG